MPTRDNSLSQSHHRGITFDRMPERPNKQIFSMRTVEKLQEEFNESRKLFPTHDDIQRTTLQLMATLTRLQGAVEHSLTSLPSSGTSSPRIGGGRHGTGGSYWRSPAAEVLVPPPALAAYENDSRFHHNGFQGANMTNNTSASAANNTAGGAAAAAASAFASRHRLGRFERNRIGRLLADVVLDAATLCNICNATLGEEENLLVPVSLETPKVEDTPFLEFDPVAELPSDGLALEGTDAEDEGTEGGGGGGGGGGGAGRGGYGLQQTHSRSSSRVGPPLSSHYRRTKSGSINAGAQQRPRSASGTAPLPSDLPRPNSARGHRSGSVSNTPTQTNGSGGTASFGSAQSGASGTSANNHHHGGAHSAGGAHNSSVGARSSVASTARPGAGALPHALRADSIPEASRSNRSSQSIGSRQLGSSLNAKFVLSVSSCAQMHDSAALRHFYKLVMSLRPENFTDEEFDSMDMRFCIPNVFPPISVPGSPNGTPHLPPPSSSDLAVREGTIELVPYGVERRVHRSDLSTFQQLVSQKVIELEGEDFVRTISAAVTPMHSFRAERAGAEPPRTCTPPDQVCSAPGSSRGSTTK